MKPFRFDEPFPPIVCIDGVDWQVVLKPYVEFYPPRHSLGIKRIVGDELIGAWCWYAGSYDPLAIADICKKLAVLASPVIPWGDPAPVLV